jgi:osmotically-inducible protein OsmY
MLKLGGLSALFLIGALSACTPIGAAVSTGAAVGSAAVEERGVGGTISDGKIKMDISERFFAHDFEMFRKVDLIVREGRVLMTGSVQKPEHRVDAVRLSWQTVGVKEVINEIQVVDSTSLSDQASDVWIATRLRSAILFDKYVSAVNYTIDVVNGTVYLMGIAQDEREIERVVNHARNLPRVRKVVSHMVTKKDPRRGG